jgi:hypothetical protein
MQTIFTKLSIARLLKSAVMMITAVTFVVLQSAKAQVIYQNANLISGTTTSNGTAAPAGFQWSETQSTNINAGFSASIAFPSSVADNFTVPAGQTFNLTKVVFYAYSTGYAGATSPFNDVRVRIFNTAPTIGAATSPTAIFGDFTTNRFSASTATTIYRIFTATPGTTRLVWRVEANVATTLTAGTYWINWQLGTIAGVTSNFSPAKVVIGASNAAGDNAQQLTTTWANIVDGTPAANQDMPFDLIGTITGSPCTTPAPGATISSIATGCPGTPFNLSLTNATPGVGVTYQWQQAAAAGGPYTNIVGATSSTYGASVTTGGFYQCVVSCATGAGSTGTSTPVQVALTPPTGCYCTTSLASSTVDEDIFRVRIGGIDNQSTCTSLGTGFGSILNRYANYTSGTGAPAAGDVIIGANNPISLTSGTCGGNFTNSFAVFIDLNQDGDFVDAGERVFQSAAGVVGPHTVNGFVVIPAGVAPTTTPTRMRVVNVETGTPASITPCGGYTWGETEDYNVNLVPCIPVTITGNPSNATISCSNSATFTAAAAGSVPAYQWQFRNPGSTTNPSWQTVAIGSLPAGVTFTGANAASLAISAIPESMNGYEFRALVSGGCTAPSPTTAAVLTVNPLAAVITPNTTICAGNTTFLPIAIGNVGVPLTSTFSSIANIGAPIPEDGTGVTNNITVAGLPGGAQLTNIRVRLNVTHTWVGDLIVALRAPNGKIFNLSYALNGTNNAGTGFTNTFVNFANNPVTAAPFPLLNSGAGTYSSTFRPDGRTAATATPLNNGLNTAVRPTGPTGVVPNTDIIAELYGAPNDGNGVWTLGLYDFYDDGTNGGTINRLVNWSLDLTYGALANGMFTTNPAGGAMFTNAAGTVPYVAGTMVNTVYVNPTATTTYNAAINTGVCSVSGASTVTVNQPPAGALVVANKATCSGTAVSFSFTGLTAGTGLSYQWQVSTPLAPTTFTNITGATAATYTIASPTLAMSGNSYRVVVSAAACTSTITSAAGTLTVNPVPVVTIGAAPVTSLFPGLTSTLTAAVSPNAASNYKWFLNGSPVAGATTGSTVVNVNNLGTYTVEVTDVNGCVANAGASTPSSIVVRDSATARLFIYPNPSSNGQFEVRYYNDANNRFATPESVNVYDNTGRRVFTQRYTAGAGYARMIVNLGPAAAKGIYRVDLVTTQGDRLATGSVLVN